MKVTKTFLNAAKLASVAVMATGLIATPVSVLAQQEDVYNSGVLVHDDFDHLFYKPNPNAYWFVENRGYLDGQEFNSRETNCDLQTCVHVVNENGDKFTRLEVHAHDHAGFFTLANLSELEDGLGSNDNPSGAWTPSVDHPITLETKLRFAPNMNVDGSGGAVGSAGINLWNNPYSPSPTSQGPNQNFIGYGWSYNGAALQGLLATVVQQTFPVYIQPVSNIDMHDWNDFKFVWSIDDQGAQSVNFYINDNFVGTSAVPGFQNLSLEAWVDNQQFTFTGINDVAVPQGDYMDIGGVTIQKV